MGSESEGAGKMLHRCVGFVSVSQYDSDKHVTKDTLVRCEHCLQHMSLTEQY